MRRLLTGIVIMAFASQAAFAQDARPNTRQGFWIGFGLGVGSAGVDCGSCSSDRTSGGSGYFRLGGTLSPSLLLGGETNGWLHSEGGVDETIGFASVALLWYPSRTGALFLKFGLGGMNYVANDGVDELTATAPSLSLGVGYDIRLARNFSITPYLNSLASSSVQVKFNGQSLPTNGDVTVNLVQLGVGVTWH